MNGHLANGRSHKQIWCCVFPTSAPNKSYALQVALIISAGGAELCLCLGAGRSQLRGHRMAEAEQALQELQKRLASIPSLVVDALQDALPADVSYRKSWLQPPGTRDFGTLSDWLAYAASSTGAGASISRNIDAEELDRLGIDIGRLIHKGHAQSVPGIVVHIPTDRPVN